MAPTGCRLETGNQVGKADVGTAAYTNRHSQGVPLHVPHRAAPFAASPPDPDPARRGTRGRRRPRPPRPSRPPLPTPRTPRRCPRATPAWSTTPASSPSSSPRPGRPSTPSRPPTTTAPRSRGSWPRPSTSRSSTRPSRPACCTAPRRTRPTLRRRHRQRPRGRVRDHRGAAVLGPDLHRLRPGRHELRA